MHAGPVLMTVALLFLAATGWAGQLTERPGWVVIPTEKTFKDLVDGVRAAAKDNGMGVVTMAGPTEMAAKRGIIIPGNRVIGIFNNDFAVRILSLSTAAMIEAPIRMYVTENPDGTTTLAYKTPTHVFAPYMEEAGPELADLAAKLDERFAAISSGATK